MYFQPTWSQNLHCLLPTRNSNWNVVLSHQFKIWRRLLFQSHSEWWLELYAPNLDLPHCFMKVWCRQWFFDTYFGGEQDRQNLILPFTRLLANQFLGWNPQQLGSNPVGQGSVDRRSDCLLVRGPRKSQLRRCRYSRSKNRLRVVYHGKSLF